MYKEWTTEVPQYRNNTAQIRGGGAHDSSSSNLASCRGGDHSTTVNMHYYVGFCLALEVRIWNLENL